MQLKEFIKETLCQITQGVEEAQAELEKNNEIDDFDRKAMISPSTPMQPLKEKGIEPYQVIDFDVAVTAESGAEAGGGISVFGWGEAKAAVRDSSVTANRIRFKIPVRLPSIRE